VSTVIVVPVVAPPTERFIVGNLNALDGSPVALVDNTGTRAWAEYAYAHNWWYLGERRRLSLAAAWNRAIVDGPQAANVALLSASCSVSGGALLDAVERHGDPSRGLLTTEAFHLIVFARQVFDTIGLFDENFFPAYYEDNDFVRRLELADIHSPANPMPKVAMRHCRCATAWHLKNGYAKPDFGRLGDYYRQKWGGDPGHETYERPFGKVLELSWWPGCHATRYRDDDVT
jgi:hypothetical protein